MFSQTLEMFENLHYNDWGKFPSQSSLVHQCHVMEVGITLWVRAEHTESVRLCRRCVRTSILTLWPRFFLCFFWHQQVGSMCRHSDDPRWRHAFTCWTGFVSMRCRSGGGGSPVWWCDRSLRSVGDAGLQHGSGLQHEQLHDAVVPAGAGRNSAAVHRQRVRQGPWSLQGHHPT